MSYVLFVFVAGFFVGNVVACNHGRCLLHKLINRWPHRKTWWI